MPNAAMIAITSRNCVSEGGRSDSIKCWSCTNPCAATKPPSRVILSNNCTPLAGREGIVWGGNYAPWL
jgi:hypothetical protein